MLLMIAVSAGYVTPLLLTHFGETMGTLLFKNTNMETRVLYANYMFFCKAEPTERMDWLRIESLHVGQFQHVVITPPLVQHDPALLLDLELKHRYHRTIWFGKYTLIIDSTVHSGVYMFTLYP